MTNDNPTISIDELPEIPSSQSHQGGLSRRGGFRIGGDSRQTSRDVSSDEDAEMPAGTPSLSEVRRTLSYKSLQSIDRKLVRNTVWRPPNQPKKRPRDLDQLLGHSLRTSIRAAAVAWGARTTFNMLFFLLSVMRSRRLDRHRLLKTLLAPSAQGLAKMFGSFALLYQLTYGGLRIYNPGPRGQGHGERWHAAVAGAVSGLSILGDLPDARMGIAQQFLVRGLESVVNQHNLKVPHGAVLLFGLACGQNWNWIASASQSPRCMPYSYGDWVRHGTQFPANVPPQLLKIKGITERNRTLLEQALKHTEGDKVPHKYFDPCQWIHPTDDSCLSYNAMLGPRVVRWILPVYAALNFAPPMVLKTRSFIKDPLKQIIKSTKGAAKGCTFLAVFVVIFHSGAYQTQTTLTHTAMCIRGNAWRNEQMPAWLRSLVLHRSFMWAAGFSTCASLLVDSPKRRGDLAIYVLPKAGESVWESLRRRGLVKTLPAADVLMASAGLALLSDGWQHSRSSLNSLVKSIFYQVLGP